MIRAGLVLSAVVAVVWLVAVVNAALTLESDIAGPLAVAVYSGFALWGLVFVWLAVAVGALARRAHRYFAKPS